MKKLIILLAISSTLALTGCNGVKSLFCCNPPAFTPTLCQEQQEEYIPVYACPKCRTYERLTISVDLINGEQAAPPIDEDCDGHDPSSFLGYYQPGAQILVSVGRKNTYTLPFKIGIQKIKVNGMLFSRPIDTWAIIRVAPSSHSEDGSYATSYSVSPELDLHSAYY